MDTTSSFINYFQVKNIHQISDLSKPALHQWALNLIVHFKILKQINPISFNYVFLYARLILSHSIQIRYLNKNIINE
jgi:hypothetical protein